MGWKAHEEYFEVKCRKPVFPYTEKFFKVYKKIFWFYQKVGVMQIWDGVWKGRV